GERIAIHALLCEQDVIGEHLAEEPNGRDLTTAWVPLERRIEVLADGRLQRRITNRYRPTDGADTRTGSDLGEAGAGDAARIGQSCYQLLGEVITALQRRESVGIRIGLCRRGIGVRIAVVEIATVAGVRGLDPYACQQAPGTVARRVLAVRCIDILIVIGVGGGVSRG